MAKQIHNLSSSFLDRDSSSCRPSSPTGSDSSSQDHQVGAPALSRTEVIRLHFDANPARAQEFLENLPVVRNGFCYESVLAPSKEDGYVQLSASGANKFCTLGEMLGWAAGIHLSGGLQISHRCNHPKCTIPAHVCAESCSDNNGRKNCLVWVHCPHDDCPLKILVCPHFPLCIKYTEDFETWEEFLKWGVHKVRA